MAISIADTEADITTGKTPTFDPKEFHPAEQL
jgi:hypothetical protein